MERLLVVGPPVEAAVVLSMLDTSWYTDRRTVPVSLICGRTRRVRPTSLRSKVLNGVAAALLSTTLPVVKGTCWPTTILASSLSRVSKVGVDKILASPLVCKKLAKAPSM